MNAGERAGRKRTCLPGFQSFILQMYLLENSRDAATDRLSVGVWTRCETVRQYPNRSKAVNVKGCGAADGIEWKGREFYNAGNRG